MATHNLLDRLSDAAPAILSDSESIVGVDEETRLLETILHSDVSATPPAAFADRNAVPRWRRPLAGVAAAIVVLGAASVAVVATRGTNPRTTATRSTAASQTNRPPTSATKSTRTLTLADFHFTLPAGFEASHNSCVQVAVDGLPYHSTAVGAKTKLPAGAGTNRTVHLPITGNSAVAAAVSAQGGCVEAVLVMSTTVPAAARPVPVAAYRGFLEALPGSTQELFVAIPAAEGDHYLVLIARGISGRQLVAVATSALPVATGPKNGCASNCG